MTDKELTQYEACMERFHNATGYYPRGCLRYEGDLVSTTTPNTEPPRQGQWIWDEENECWICSVCKLAALNNYRGNSTNSPFCPHCGTSMVTLA
jgi:hypothetical protein